MATPSTETEVTVMMEKCAVATGQTVAVIIFIQAPDHARQNVRPVNVLQDLQAAIGDEVLERGIVIAPLVGKPCF